MQSARTIIRRQVLRVTHAGGSRSLLARLWWTLALVAGLASAFSQAACLSDDGAWDASDDADKGISPQTYEVAGVLKGKVIIPHWGTEAEKRAWISEVMANPTGTETRYIDHIVAQAKFMRNGLVPGGIYPNFVGRVRRLTQAMVHPYGIELSYEYEIRAAVIKKAKPNGGALIGKSYGYQVPMFPTLVITQSQQACVKTPDGGEPIQEFNAFYYYSPTRAGCTIDKTNATFTVESADVTDPTVYPEYTRLAADGIVKFAVMYGQAETDTLSDDEAMLQYAQEVIGLMSSELGFTDRGAITKNGVEIGRRFELNSFGVVIQAEIYTPRAMDLSRPPSEVADTMEEVFRANEIILYAGHSRYGALEVFNRPSAFAAPKYQIFILGSCHSYMYYADRIINAKRTTTDPTGYANVDVLGTVKAGMFSDATMETNLVLELAQNAALYGRLPGAADAQVSWNQLIKGLVASQIEESRHPDYHGAYEMSHWMLLGAESNAFQPK